MGYIASRETGWPHAPDNPTHRQATGSGASNMAGGLAGTKIKEDRVSLNVRTRTIGLVLLSVALAGAQITITPGEIPQTPGDTFTWKYTITRRR